MIGYESLFPEINYSGKTSNPKHTMESIWSGATSWYKSPLQEEDFLKA